VMVGWWVILRDKYPRAVIVMMTAFQVYKSQSTRRQSRIGIGKSYDVVVGTLEEEVEELAPRLAKSCVLVERILPAVRSVPRTKREPRVRVWSKRGRSSGREFGELTKCSLTVICEACCGSRNVLMLL
jgi:hypothetical protein